MFTNKKREGINRFVCDLSLYVAETPKASIKYRKLLLPIIPFGIVAYGFVGQPFSKQLYAIDGKKWVKFVAMQQNSATLIYDLNTMKGTVGSYLKVHLTPKFFFGRDETVQHSHKEFDNFISIW